MDRKKIRSDELEARLATLEKDYENYKVRAQSVLRQAKDKVTNFTFSGTYFQYVNRLLIPKTVPINPGPHQREGGLWNEIGSVRFRISRADLGAVE